MELWGVPYDDVMSLPYSRRKRMVENKQDLEKRRANRQKTNAGINKARRRR